MVTCAIAGFFIFAIVGGVGLGVASANSADELARAGAFGVDTAARVEVQSEGPASDGEAPASKKKASANKSAEDLNAVVYEQSALTSPSSRDISSGLKMIDDKERAEQERIAAENAAAIERMEAEKAKQGVVSQTVAAPAATEAESSDSADVAANDEVQEEQAEPVIEYNLPAVDWTVGKEAFVTEWSQRIDAYLAGSPLEGYGAVFAEAAWDSGVDPRWSPAISNTESSKGSVCFMSHNAWGWGASGWSDWDTAIRTHVAGLASGYGYSITPEAAYTYCPPNHVNWYNDTLSQMALI